MDVFEAIRSRRSTRAYQDVPVDDDALNHVIEAGRFAPSGGNNQTTHFLVIRSRQLLDELADLVRTEFSKMDVAEGMYRSLANAIRAAKSGRYVFHHHAPVLIVTANRIGYGNGMADCACALENMMLMANGLGLGSCWINQLHWLSESEAVCAFLRRLGMAENEQAFGALSLGHAQTSDGLPAREPLPRTGNPVTFIG
ncbi:MAG: nitroreductase family protein [Desulfovibrionaceae bacterium]|nr:nitroreductase family protein [Desulfovibrionaceae bacterium]